MNKVETGDALPPEYETIVDKICSSIPLAINCTRDEQRDWVHKMILEVFKGGWDMGMKWRSMDDGLLDEMIIKEPKPKRSGKIKTKLTHKGRSKPSVVEGLDEI